MQTSPSRGKRKPFGNYLAFRRKREKLSQPKLAKKSGLFPNKIWRIEAGTDPKLGDVERLAHAFNEGLTQFLGGWR